jgi:hypothetical protein
MRAWCIAVLASAAASATAPTVASSPVNLTPGAYVSAPNACRSAAQGSLTWFNGRFFSTSRMSNVVREPSRRVDAFRGSFYAHVDGGSGEPMPVTIKVNSATSFTWTSWWGTVRYRLCRDTALPAIWRGHVPR